MDHSYTHQSQPLTGHAQCRLVHTITDRFSMSNTYLIEDERLFVVDPGTELNVQQLQSYVHTFLRRSINDVDLIVLTHLHPDHTSGALSLQHLCQAPIAASTLIRTLAQKEREDRRHLPSLTHLAEYVLPTSLHHMDLFIPAYERQMRLVNLWLEDTQSLPFHPSWRVIASPGHTPDSLCLYNPQSLELLCGDTVITIQGGAPLLRGTSNRRQLEETLRVLRSLSVHYLYPGHGRPILGLRPLHNVDVEW